MFVYSYKGYTITQDIMTGHCSIVYPDNTSGESDMKTKSLTRAYNFIDAREKQNEVR